MDSQDIINDFKKFQESSKNVEYKNSVVGILKILGFKNVINKEDVESLKKLQNTIASELFTNKSLVSFNNINIDILSDTFIVSSEDIASYSAKSVITILENIRRGLMNNGFLSRGGVVSGNHFFKDGILISPAFIKAYEIEEKEAIYPRIILENTLVNFLEKSEKNEKENFFPQCIIEKDFDGYFVIRPFIQIPEIATFCEKECYGKKFGTDDPQCLEDAFKNQIEFYKKCLEQIYNNISLNCQHQIAKVNYLMTKYNEVLDLCKFYKDKKYLGSMKLKCEKRKI